MGLFTKKIEIKSPIKGKLIDITEVKDEAFSSKALGDGMAIIPADGKVFSPIDGEVITMIDTNHAIGLETKGVEILIHIGMDTVKLDGKHFTSHIEEGQKIKKGDLLMEFDTEKIKEEGYSAITPIVITNFENYGEIEETTADYINAGDILLNIKK